MRVPLTRTLSPLMAWWRSGPRPVRQAVLAVCLVIAVLRSRLFDLVSRLRSEALLKLNLRRLLWGSEDLSNSLNSDFALAKPSMMWFCTLVPLLGHFTRGLIRGSDTSNQESEILVSGATWWDLVMCRNLICKTHITHVVVE